MKPGPIVLAVVIIVGVIAAGVYYSSAFSSSSSAGSVTVNIEIIGGVGAATTDSYSPNTFTVKEGENVTLSVLNTDDNTHGLAIKAFGVDTGKIPSGGAYRVSFVANETGTFEYYEPPGYCGGGVGNACNSVQDMTGNMTVAP